MGTSIKIMAETTSDSGRSEDYLKKRRKVTGSRNRAQDSKRAKSYRTGKQTVGGAKPQPKSTKVTASNTKQSPRLPKVPDKAPKFKKPTVSTKLSASDKVRISTERVKHIDSQIQRNDRKIQRLKKAIALRKTIRNKAIGKAGVLGYILNDIWNTPVADGTMTGYLKRQKQQQK